MAKELIKGPLGKPRGKRLGRPQGRDSADTRAAILSSAKACLVEQGYGGTTLKGVAMKAGLTPAAIYPYFPSKPVLYAAVFHEVMESLLVVYRQALALELPFKEKLKMVLLAAVDLHENDADATAILATIPIELKRHPELANLLVDGQEQLNDGLRAIFRQAVERGEAPKGYDAEDLLLTFIGGSMGMALLQYGGDIGSMKKSTRLLLELVDRLD